MYSTAFLTPTSYLSESRLKPPLDHIPPAGKPSGTAADYAECTRTCLQFGQPRPVTPPHEKKYRQSALHEPGKMVRHFGRAEDSVPDGVVGKKTISKKGESVAEYIAQVPKSNLLAWKQAHDEEIYASSKQEPLGKGYVRGHKIPEGLGTIKAFGVAVNAKELAAAGQAKTVIFPADAPMGSSQDPNTPGHELYVRSHGAYSAGQQRKRDYDWERTGVDPVRHSFGMVSKEVNHGALKALLAPEAGPMAGTARVVDKRLEDFQLTHHDELGRVKHLGTGERHLPEGHTFGVPSVRKGAAAEAGVEQLLKGYLSPEEQAPDADLGKSLREGFRNIAPPDRVFGLPSIRMDIPRPANPSVANVNNYGNEPDTLQLIHPTASAERGVSEEHYLQLRTREEMRELVSASGLAVSEREFERAFNLAARLDGSPHQQHCCIDSLMRVRHRQLEEQALQPLAGPGMPPVGLFLQQ